LNPSERPRIQRNIPNFIAEAKAGKENSARWTFEVTNKLEQIHAISKNS
jgi:hypothetical protein